MSRWRYFGIRTKLALIPGFFLLAITLLITYAVTALDDLRASAQIVNSCGQQRMLNERILNGVLLTSQGLTSSDLVEETRHLLDETLDALLHGGTIRVGVDGEQTVRVRAVEDTQVRELLNRQKRLQAEYGTLAEKVAATPPDDPGYQAAVDELGAARATLQGLIGEQTRRLTALAKSRVDGMIGMELLLGCLVVLAGLLLSWLIWKGIAVPLGGVISLAERISHGDLRGEELVKHSEDEVGKLADTFNTMTGSLRELTRQIRSVTEDVNSAATQISSSTQQQASSTREQAATIQQITSTMQQITQSGAEIISRAEQIAATAESTSQSSDSGLDAVRQTNQTMDAIREQVEEVAENIVTLSEKTQAIAEIVSTVNEVAEQSNLLALNAAIEAADAGEQGSRFTVVANEMKNLAEQAKQCTVQVRSILGDIQKGINSSVMLTEEAVKRVDSGKQQSEVSEEAILQMANSIKESVQGFQQIIGATNQQQVGFEQVAQGMQDIDRAASDTASGTAQLEQAVSNLSSTSQQLRTAVGRYQI